MAKLKALQDEYVDLESVPRHRHFGHEPIIERTRVAVPFDNVMIVGLDIDRYDFATFRSVDTDIPPAFFDAYIGERLYVDDPYVVASLGQADVLTEEDAYASNSPSSRLRYVLTAFGLHNRTFFLLRRSHTVYGAVAFSRSTPFNCEEMVYLEMLARPLHANVTAPLMADFATAKLKLNEGEIACLRMASRGMTSEEIASRSAYQVDTVNTYFKTAARKLGASNRVQGIAEALRRGLID